MKFLQIISTAVPVLFGVTLAAGSAHAGTIILEGSDAIGLHCTASNDSDACDYEAQVWHALSGNSGLPIAALGNPYGPIGSVGSGITIDNFSSATAASLAGSGGLAQYAAIYLADGCCQENDSLVNDPGDRTLLTTYLNGGGTIMIENYTGGSAFDFLVGTTGGANQYVAGASGGAGGSSCSDGEVVTADGLINGFTQPGVIGCWGHQGYDSTYFATLGFTHSYFVNPDYSGLIGADTLSSLLSTGRTITGVENTPEPGSLAMIGGGILALVFARRRYAR